MSKDGMSGKQASEREYRAGFSSGQQEALWMACSFIISELDKKGDFATRAEALLLIAEKSAIGPILDSAKFRGFRDGLREGFDKVICGDTPDALLASFKRLNHDS